MINAITESISRALDAEFGGRCKIYMEEKEQDLEGPCFFIQCLNPTGSLFLGRRYFRRSQFCIQYFPASESSPNRECNGVAEQMYACLEYIDLGGPWQGTGMNSRVEDGILHFFVNYDGFVYRQEEETPAMEELEVHSKMKGGS